MVLLKDIVARSSEEDVEARGETDSGRLMAETMVKTVADVEVRVKFFQPSG